MSAIDEKSSQHSATATERYLNILEEPQPKPEEEIDEEKFRFIASKTSIWDFYGTPQSKYLAYSRKGIKNVHRLLSDISFQIFWCW